MARPDRNRNVSLAAGGILSAGSLALLWVGCITPSGRIGMTAAAGLFPMLASVYAGSAAGCLCWAAASVLGLILLPDKGIALLFLTFLGLYPVGKGRIESLRRLWLEWGLKLSWFNLVLTLFWFLFQALFLPNAPQWLEESTLLCYVLGNVIFAAYDLGLSQVISRLRTHLRR